MAIITLLTDFGVQDEYVGVLKGVLLGINPLASIVDISHGIDPQDIVAAAHILQAAYPYFPGGTVHAAVVDPGVGTQRRIIAATANGHRFVAPDNGLLAPILKDCEPHDIYLATNKKLFRHPVSHTFHGRDIIAPVVAHLSAGVSLEEVGPAAAFNDIQPLKEMNAQWISPKVLVGRVIGIDHFGNLLTNIHSHDLERMGGGDPLITVGKHQISGMHDTYADGVADEPIALWSSRNTLEIAVKEGNAARILRLNKGVDVRVTIDLG